MNTMNLFGNFSNYSKALKKALESKGDKRESYSNDPWNETVYFMVNVTFGMTV